MPTCTPDNPLFYSRPNKYFPISDILGAKIKFVGIVSNRTLETTFDFEGHDTTVESDLHNGCVLVTTADGDAACYHVDVHGKVTKSSADEMLNMKKFDPDKVRNIFGNMVLLEMVKMGRSVDANKNIIAQG